MYGLQQEFRKYNRIICFNSYFVIILFFLFPFSVMVAQPGKIQKIKPTSFKRIHIIKFFYLSLEVVKKVFG